VLVSAVLMGALLLSACQASSSKEAHIYVSLPLQGPKIGASVWKGIDLAVKEIGEYVGGTQVVLVVRDSGDPNGQWQASKEEKNAQDAAADPQAVAYIGPIDSAAAKISLPILNQAGIVQISPSATWPGLTKAGYVQGEPGLFYPTGKRNFYRIVTTDDVQGPAAARWAKSLGVVTYYMVDDGEAYGSGIANLFEGFASQIALVRLGRTTIDKSASDYREILTRIKEADPDLVYFSGTVANGGGRFLKQMREMGIDALFMGPDALLDTSLIAEAGTAAEGALVTFLGVPPSELTSADGQNFLKAYREAYPKEPQPESYAQLGYDAARVIIAALSDASTDDRLGVWNAMRVLAPFAGVSGTFSFDQNGDTTLRELSGNVVEDGAFKFMEQLTPQ
jgi:branched-chain amino acid transport system substrate-binding protein